MQRSLKRYVCLLSLVLSLSLVLGVFAQEEGNETAYGAYESLPANATSNISEDFNEKNLTNATETSTKSNGDGMLSDGGQKEATDTTETANATNTTTLAMAEIVNFTVSVTPAEAKQGDIVLTVNVENTGTVSLSNLIPVVTGRGFSAYDVVPIEDVAPGETGAAYVLGQFDASGEIALIIKIHGKSVTQTVTVQESAQQNTEELQAAKTETLAILSKQVDHLENDYGQLEDALSEKQDDYSVADVNLDELKGYMRAAQSYVLAGQVEEANRSIILAMTEYADVQNRVEHAKRKSFFDKIRENILPISTLAGAILTLVAFIEFVKRKQQGLYQKIKEFKVDQDTKIEVHKKKESKKKKEKMQRKEKDAEAVGTVILDKKE